MKAPTPTWRELLSQLAENEYTQEAVRTHLHNDEQKGGPPWFLALFAGIGAWISALFALIFCIFVMNLWDSGGGCMVMGVLFFGCACFLSRQVENVFGHQFSLAALLTGNALILFGTAVLMEADFFVGILLIQIIIALVTFFCYRGALGMFITLIALPQLAVAWCLQLENAHALHLIVAVLAVAVVGLGLWRQRPRALDPAAYAAICALPLSLLTMEMLRGESWFSFAKLTTPLWPSSIVLAAAVVVWISYGRGSYWKEVWFRLVVAVLVILSLFTSPGVLVALLLLIMGKSQGERLIMGLGYVFLLVFLSFHYYALDVSLAHKSWVIGGSGLLLLITRWLADRLIRFEVKEVSV
jgi:hypothetical protein